MKWLGVIFLLALIFQTSTIPVSTENETNPTTTPLDEHDVELTSKLPKLTDLIAKHNKSKTAKIRHWPLNLEGFVVIPIEFDATSGYCKYTSKFVL